MKKSLLFILVVFVSLGIFLFGSERRVLRDFNFKIPIKIINANLCMESVTVTAIVSSTRFPSAIPSNIICKSKKIISIGRQTRTFINVTISVDADSGKNPLDAKSWMTRLTFKKKGGSNHYDPDWLTQRFPSLTSDALTQKWQADGKIKHVSSVIFRPIRISSRSLDIKFKCTPISTSERRVR